MATVASHHATVCAHSVTCSATPLSLKSMPVEEIAVCVNGNSIAARARTMERGDKECILHSGVHGSRRSASEPVNYTETVIQAQSREPIGPVRVSACPLSGQLLLLIATNSELINTHSKRQCGGGIPVVRSVAGGVITVVPICAALQSPRANRGQCPEPLLILHYSGYTPRPSTLRAILKNHSQLPYR